MMLDNSIDVTNTGTLSKYCLPSLAVFSELYCSTMWFHPCGNANNENNTHSFD